MSVNSNARKARVTRPVRLGTTEAVAIPVRSAGLCPAWVSRPSSCKPYSSGIRAWSVASRQCQASVSPSYKPMVRLVLPMSMVSSIMSSSVRAIRESPLQSLFRCLDNLRHQIITVELRHDVNTLPPFLDLLD